MLKRFLLVAGSLFLLSCSQLNHHEKENTTDAVIKSISDTREYRSIRLPNGLRAVLVSDAKADSAAASLDVFVGSAQNPKNRAGLAHFLEHMLFLGTEKYPDASEYQAFMKANGGSNNAYTSFEHTNYFFDIKPTALEQGLDRFAQFFIAPLFDEQYVEREKNAVNAEYQAGLKSESRRNFAVLRELVNQQNPFSQFSVGNLDTLSSSKKPVREDLLAFYRKHYVAENMTLAILGNQSLDQLEAMLRAKFSVVPTFADLNADAPRPDYTITQPLFNAGQLPQWAYIKPEKNTRSLNIVFALPSQQAFYPDRSLDVIGHVLGHEGAGSLLSYLKSLQLAEGLAVGQFVDYRGGTSFSLSVSLTKQGVEQQEAILKAIFSTMTRLRQQGIPRWVFDELAMISRLSFDYQNQQPAGRAVVHLASQLQRYSARDVLRANYVFEDYDESRVSGLLSLMTIDKALITSVYSNAPTDKITQYYQVPYSVKPLPKGLLGALTNPAINKAVHLPEKNRFLPEQLKLTKATQQQYPIKLIQETGFSAWYKGREQFNTPRSVMYFSFQHPNITQQLSNAVLLELYVDLLNDSLNELVYPAGLAGMNFELYPNARGMTLKVSGFSEKQADLLLALMKEIQASAFANDQFERIKSSLQKHWQNAEQRMPYKKILARLRQKISVGAWGNQEKLAELNALQLTDVQAFKQRFWQSLNVQALFNGNLTKKQALTVATEVKQSLPALTDTRSVLGVVKLQQAVHEQVVCDHSDKAYALYVQSENNDFEQQALWMLLSKVLEANFFNQLRTEQQLGYIVFATYYAMLDVPGMLFTVQSPVAEVSYLHQAVTGFLTQQLPRVGLLGQSQFASYKDAVLQELLERDSSLEEESDRYWYLMAMNGASRPVAFDRREQLADTLRQLDLSRWHQFAKVLSQQGLPFKRSYLVTTPTPEALPGFGVQLKSGDVPAYQYP